MAEAGSCVSCGTELAGPFCHACGERALRPEDLRVGTFVRRAAGAVFDADSRLWRSFRLLLFRPGELTAEFVAGRREPYVHPFQVFLLANLVFFVVLNSVGGFSTFTTRLEHHLTGPFYGVVASDLVEVKGAPGTAAAIEYERSFDDATPNYANSMLILMVPMYAAGLALLFVRRREPFVKHLVFALHFMAFLLLLITVMPFAIAPIVALFPGSTALVASELPVTLLLVTLLSWYLALGFRAAYADRRWRALARAIVAALMLMPALWLYRAILFFTVYLTLD